MPVQHTSAGKVMHKFSLVPSLVGNCKHTKYRCYCDGSNQYVNLRGVRFLFCQGASNSRAVQSLAPDLPSLVTIVPGTLAKYLHIGGYFGAAFAEIPSQMGRVMAPGFAHRIRDFLTSCFTNVGHFAGTQEVPSTP